MYLLDTNVWLERLLNQTRAPEVERLLDTLDASELALSDFSLHSIGVILGRRGRLALLDQFTTDLCVENRVTLLALTGVEMHSVAAAMQSQHLDFDDAHQYVVAKRGQLTFVSFDADFDHTDLVRQTPAQVLAVLAAPPPAGQT
jgi:hypothetical protein